MSKVYIVVDDSEEYESVCAVCSTLESAQEIKSTMANQILSKLTIEAEERYAHMLANPDQAEHMVKISSDWEKDAQKRGREVNWGGTPPTHPDFVKHQCFVNAKLETASQLLRIEEWTFDKLNGLECRNVV